jgi:cytochrome c oxidase assembly protein subunit 15
MFSFYPWWSNFFENAASVQFTHRVLAILTFFTLMFMASKILSKPVTIRIAKLLIAVQVMACLQVGLGISTLESHVNIVIATLHQAGALTSMALLMALLHNIPRPEGTR